MPPDAPCRRISGLLLLLLIIPGLPGCASLTRIVEFTVPGESRVILSRVQSLAILDFAVPLGRKSYGRKFAALVSRVFSNQDQYRIIPPAASRPLLSARRLLPSHFQKARVIIQMGQELQADALLFGDISGIRLHKDVKPETFRRKVGEKRRTRKIIDADGNTRTVVKIIPVYKDFWRRKIKRTVMLQAGARLLRTKDSAVLWENTIQIRRSFTSVEEEGGIRKGNWKPEHELINQLLEPAARRLVKDLLTRTIIRRRRLISAAGRDEYSRLVENGIRTAWQNNWEEAGSLWLRAAASAPGRPEARANLGVLREHTGDFQQALKDYKFVADKLGPPWRDYAAQVKGLLDKKKGKTSPLLSR